MSVNSSSNRYPLDALLVLRPSGLAAVTATTATATLPLDVPSGYWRQPPENANLLDFAIELLLEAAPTGTVVFNVDIAVDAGFTTMQTVASVTVNPNSVKYTLTIDRGQLISLAGAAYLRVNAVLSGSTPSVAFNAYVAPVVGV